MSIFRYIKDFHPSSIEKIIHRKAEYDFSILKVEELSDLVTLDEIPHFLNYVSKNSREIIIIIEKISHRNNLLRIFRKLHLRLSIYFQADIKGNLNLIASRIIPIQERSCMNLCGELNHRDKLEFDSKIYKMSKITISCKKINEIQEAKSKINYDEEKYRNFRVHKKKLIDTTNYLTKFNLKHVLISIKKTYKNQWDENLLLILISNGKSNVLISMGSAQIDFLSYKFIKKNTVAQFFYYIDYKSFLIRCYYINWNFEIENHHNYSLDNFIFFVWDR